MEANEAPKKIFVNPNALQNSGYNGKDYMFIHDSVFDESKCIIEYVRTDAFIEKACEWLKENKDKYLYNTGEKDEYIPTCSGKIIEEFRKYMEGE